MINLKALEKKNAERKARCEAATPGPLLLCKVPQERGEEFFKDCLAFGAGDVWMVGVPEHPLSINEPIDNPERMVLFCVTGNGPTSEINAKLICSARTDIPEMLSEQAELIAWAREARELVASIFCQCEPPELPDINPGYQCMRCELLSQLTEESE